MSIGDYPVELVNERPVPPYGLAKGWAKPAIGLLFAVALASLLIGVNSRVGSVDPAVQDVGQMVAVGP